MPCEGVQRREARSTAPTGHGECTSPLPSRSPGGSTGHVNVSTIDWSILKTRGLPKAERRGPEAGALFGLPVSTQRWSTREPPAPYACSGLILLVCPQSLCSEGHSLASSAGITMVRSSLTVCGIPVCGRPPGGGGVSESEVVHIFTAAPRPQPDRGPPPHPWATRNDTALRSLLSL
jgi:hypothetical protein